MNNICNHHILIFGSGDYHIFCHDCKKSWTIDDGDSYINSNIQSDRRYSATCVLAARMKRLGLYETADMVLIGGTV